jgi:hypothetical protein
MKNILVAITIIVVSFLIFSCGIIPLLFIFFTPVLPIMLLAFPMTFVNQGTGKVHWTEKPFLWYFNNVWLKSMYFVGILKRV